MANYKTDSELDEILAQVQDEAVNADTLHGPYYSVHHGYGVLLEELDELWDEIKVKQDDRDLDKLKKEAIQVAACAIRIAHMIDIGRGRV